MRALLKNIDIKGIITIVPEKVLRFEDEIDNFDFTPKSSMKLKKAMGLGQRRIVDVETTGADLCFYGLGKLLKEGGLVKEEIDALIYITQTPDHFIPPTSNLIQGRLGLSDDVICVDINQGCAGFLYGLYQANMMLGQPEINKVVLLNADTVSKQVSPKDRNSAPLAGDASSITLIEKAKTENTVHFNIKMDGSRGTALYIPAGAYRMQSNDSTRELKEVGDGNWRSQEHITMDGTAIFNFTMKEVPEMIEDILNYAETDKDSIDHFFFHQPNQFILKRIKTLMEIEDKKLKDDLVTYFGNTSSVTIPNVVTHYYKEEFKTQSFKCCLAAFGVGLTWSSAVLEMGNFAFCDLIEYHK